MNTAFALNTHCPSPPPRVPAETAALVDTLGERHFALAETLKALAGGPIPTSARMRQFAKQLREQFHFEDKALYAILFDRAAVLHAMAMGFQSAVSCLAVTATAFAGRWSLQEPASDPGRFRHELSFVIAQLGERIRIEEEMVNSLLDR